MKWFHRDRILAALFVIVIAAGIWQTAANSVTPTFYSMPVNKKVILIDAGHGGWDPGMIGIDGVKEKDVNLSIAEKLQQYLEIGGSTVILTRGQDEATGQTKREDLKSRKNSAVSSEADLMISIHQNSYPTANVKGAQVFYFGSSQQSKKLAESIQTQVKEYLDSENNRIAKANTDYYILKETSIPAVIVECGFLSNPEENKELTDDTYQSKTAWAIYMGIIHYYADKD